MSLRDDLTRIRAYLKKRPAIIAALRDMTEDGIKAASYEGDRTTGHDTRLFCWLHQQDPHDCHKQGFLCDGDPIPTATDITGETAIRGDRARRLTAELTVAKQRITQTAANIYDLPPITIRRATQVLAVYLEDRARHLPNVERVVQSATGTLHAACDEGAAQVLEALKRYEQEALEAAHVALHGPRNPRAARQAKARAKRRAKRRRTGS